jgi:hypothetical protein
MTIELTEELRQAIAAQPNEPVCLIDRQTNESYVVVRSAVYERIKILLEEEEDQALRKAWLESSKKTAIAWMKENPY